MLCCASSTFSETLRFVRGCALGLACRNVEQLHWAGLLSGWHAFCKWDRLMWEKLCPKAAIFLGRVYRYTTYFSLFLVLWLGMVQMVPVFYPHQNSMEDRIDRRLMKHWGEPPLYRSIRCGDTWWFIPRIVSGMKNPIIYKWTLPPLIPWKWPGL